MLGKKSTEYFENFLGQRELTGLVLGVRIMMWSWIPQSSQAPKPAPSKQVFCALPWAGLHLYTWACSAV